jgi:branched-chain amino acid transport system substrate-binding protein
MSASYAEVLTDVAQSPYNFVVAPTYSDQMRVALNWIAKDAGGKAEVAVFHNDSPFGTAPLADGEKWISEKGLQLGFKAYPMPKGTTSFTGLLSQAKAQGAKYVVIQNVSSPAAQVAKDIKANGLDMKIVCLNWCSDELFIKTAGAENAEGHILVQPFAPASAAKPGHKDLEDYLKTKGSTLSEKGVHYAQGWYTMAVMAKGIEKAIAAGGDLTGESIRKALETMDAVDTGGVVGTGTVKFSAESHRGSTGSGIYQVKGGTFVEIAANQTP